MHEHAGLHLRNGRIYVEEIRLSDGLVYVTSPCGRPRTHSYQWVIHSLNFACSVRILQPILLMLTSSGSCSRPIEKDLFLDHFWWTHSRLAERRDNHHRMAAYFRFLTLLGTLR
jgi:hypothetical protein